MNIKIIDDRLTAREHKLFYEPPGGAWHLIAMRVGKVFADAAGHLRIESSLNLLAEKLICCYPRIK